MRHPTLVAGSPAPPFTLTAQDGRARSLADYLSGGPLLLAFHRGTW